MLPPVKPRNAKYSHNTEATSKGSDQTALIYTDASKIDENRCNQTTGEFTLFCGILVVSVYRYYLPFYFP